MNKRKESVSLLKATVLYALSTVGCILLALESLTLKNIPLKVRFWEIIGTKIFHMCMPD